MNIDKISGNSGLSTDIFQVAVAGMYSLGVRSTVQQGSQLVITISQSGSVSSSVSTNPTSPVQQYLELNATFTCAIGDIIHVVLTSGALADQPPAAIQTTINLRSGL